VAQAPGALANISTAHDVPERNRLRVIETDVRIPLHLYVAIRKDAREEVKRVLEATAKAGQE
jgi:hypothetical protein